MLLKPLINLCWCALALCLCMFADILYQDYAKRNRARQTASTEELAVPGDTQTAPTYDEEIYKAGKKLFRSNCATCHNRNMKDRMTGPALTGTEERWADYPREDLYAWIRNSQLLASSGHPRALKLMQEYDGKVMTAFPQLKDEEIEKILYYVEVQSR